MKATFIGDQSGRQYYGAWSNPSNWDAGSTPVPARKLQVRLDTQGSVPLEDLGTADDPFIARSVVGSNHCQPSPLFISGSLSVRDLRNLSEVQLVPSETGATLRVSHGIYNVGSISVARGDLVELNDQIGNTIFQLRGDTGTSPGAHETTLILDKPPCNVLNNGITLALGSGAPGGNDRIELGGLTFDHADATLNVNGSETIRLTDQGALVYELTNVTIQPPSSGTGTLSVGVDPGTGWDFLSYESQPNLASAVLDEVPAYDWWHGCGPTAAASVLGYYDVHGYPQYFDASGWNAIQLTENVEDQISSPAHNAKYDPSPDDQTLPTPPATSLADFMHTSEDPLGYGWTYLSDMAAGIAQYADYRGAPANVWSEAATSSTWTEITDEILGGHPMVFLVDTNGDGLTDHFIPVFGFEDRADGTEWYASFNTWHEDESIDWYQFAPMAQGTAWGVAYVTFVEPGSAPTHPGSLDGASMAARGDGPAHQILLHSS